MIRVVPIQNLSRRPHNNREMAVPVSTIVVTSVTAAVPSADTASILTCQNPYKTNYVRSGSICGRSKTYDGINGDVGDVSSEGRSVNASQEELRARRCEFDPEFRSSDNAFCDERLEEGIVAKDRYFGEAHTQETVRGKFIDCKTRRVLAGVAHRLTGRLKFDILVFSYAPSR